jgi:hypothetical protein
MFPFNRSSILTAIWLLFGLVSTNPSTAIAVQWPVNAGPVHQPVPQYRARYPLSSLSDPKPAQQPELKFKRVEPIPNSRTNKPNELLIPDRQKMNPLPTPEAAAKRPSLRPQPPKTVEHSNPSSLSRHPQRKSAAANSGLTKTRSVLKDKEAKTKKSIAKKAKAKKKSLAPPAISYDIYRDTNPFPIDPRKPNGICTTPNRSGGCGCGQSSCCGDGSGCGHGCDAPGLHGKPYQEREPGGCRCGDKKCGKCKPMFSLYWPRPFSAKLDEHFPQQAAARYWPCQDKRFVDVFDKFADFKLINYHRTDNGYHGEDSDPYGCLGESRMIASGVAGVGYRFPSVPVDRSASIGSQWR